MFAKPAGGWQNATQTAELTSANRDRRSQVFDAVIDGDTIVAGGVRALYVFAKPAGGWVNATQTATLTAADGGLSDAFALSGETIAAGGFSEADVDRVGATYLFQKPAGGWVNATQTATLTAADGAPGDYFGASIAIDGGNIVVTRSRWHSGYHGAVYVFGVARGGGGSSSHVAPAVSRIEARVDGTISFRVKAPGPGDVDVMETAWTDNVATIALLSPAAHRFVFARAHAHISRAGPLELVVKPNARGKLLVSHHGYRVTLRLWITYTPAYGRARSIGIYGLHLAHRP